MEGLTPHRWADAPPKTFDGVNDYVEVSVLSAEAMNAVAISPGCWYAPGFDPAAAEAMNAAVPRFTKSAVAAALVRNPAFEVGTKGWRTHPLFVRDAELPDFDFPTWRVRHRPYDYETDGC